MRCETCGVIRFVTIELANASGKKALPNLQQLASLRPACSSSFFNCLLFKATLSAAFMCKSELMLLGRMLGVVVV